MRTLPFYAAILLFVLVSVAFASVQGGGQRAQQQREFLQQAAPAIVAVPANLGGWRMVRDTPFGDRVLGILKCTGHVNRTYVEDASGDRVELTVLLGPAGPLVSHSPEVCMTSTQYDLESPSTRVDLVTNGGGKIPVKRATFRARDISGSLVRVYYAWVRSDGSWVAPESPRWALGGDRGLWKVQATAVLDQFEWDEPDTTDLAELSEKRGERDSAERFLSENSETLRRLFQVNSEE